MEDKTVQLVEPTGEHPDPEVREKARRRTHSASYKRQVLGEADQCTEPGEIGSLLRRGRFVFLTFDQMAAATRKRRVDCFVPEETWS